MRVKPLTQISAGMALAAAMLVSITHVVGQAAAQPTSASTARTMKIRITIEGTTATGTLEDNPTARDFASLLPLRVPLTDYARTEKVSDLSRRLSTEGAPAGFDPSVGDIAYYAPWGNLAIFYRDFGYSAGLIKLGAVTSGGAALSRSGAMQATIELVLD